MKLACSKETDEDTCWKKASDGPLLLGFLPIWSFLPIWHENPAEVTTLHKVFAIEPPGDGTMAYG